MGFPSGAAKACDFLGLPHLPPYLRDKNQGGCCSPPPSVLPVQHLNCFPPTLLLLQNHSWTTTALLCVGEPYFTLPRSLKASIQGTEPYWYLSVILNFSKYLVAIQKSEVILKHEVLDGCCKKASRVAVK